VCASIETLPGYIGMAGKRCADVNPPNLFRRKALLNICIRCRAPLGGAGLCDRLINIDNSSKLDTVCPFDRAMMPGSHVPKAYDSCL
jgi:hypothetical protein